MAKHLRFQHSLVALAILFAILIIMTTFSFPDLFSMNYLSFWVGRGFLNIYNHSLILKQNCPWVSTLYYPPLYYYTFGLYWFVITGLGLIDKQLFLAGSCPVWNMLSNRSFLLFAKLPYLGFHLASAFVFSKFFKNKKFSWFLFWLTNPLLIFVSFIEGQFEIVPAFFILAAFYFIKTKQYYSAALMLGVGGAFKHFPFLLLPAFLLILDLKIQQKVVFFFLTLLPYILTLIPTYNSLTSNALMFGENTKMLEAGIQLGEHQLSFFLLSYTLITLCLIFQKKKARFRLLLQYSFYYLVIYFLFTFWYVQRIVWLLPSLALLTAKNNKIKKALYYLYISYFAYVLILYPGLFDQSLLQPLFPNINTSINPLQAISSLPLLSKNLLQKTTIASITAVFLWLIFLVVKQSKEEKVLITKQQLLFSTATLSAYLLLIFLSAMVF